MARDFLIRFLKSARRPAVGLTLVTLALSVGCGRSTTVVGPDGEKVAVNKKGDGVDVTFKDKQGKKAHFAGGKTVALPDGFPKDIAVYPKATPVTSMSAEEIMQVTLKTADPADKVGAFYKEKLKQDGWEIKSTTNTEQGTIYQATKQQRTLMVIIAAEPDNTMIHLTVTSEK